MGGPHFNSAKLNENQAENSTYEILAYQKKSETSICRPRSLLATAASCFGPMMSAIFSSTASPPGSIARSTRKGAEFDTSYKLGV